MADKQMYTNRLKPTKLTATQHVVQSRPSSLTDHRILKVKHWSLYETGVVVELVFRSKNKKPGGSL